MWLVGHRVAKAERVGWVCFSEFFLDDKTAAAAVFSSCSFVPLTLFGTSLVMASYYGYEI